MLHDDNVTQSETALTNQLIAVVNSVGNEAFVDEMKKKDWVAGSGQPDRQTTTVLERGIGHCPIEAAIHTLL